MSRLSEKTLEENYQGAAILIEPNNTLVYVAVKCLLCGKVLESHDKHMISSKCQCINEVRILGGLENPRYYAKNIKHAMQLSVYAHESFTRVRRYATRGCIDKEKNAIVFVPLDKLPDNVLERALESGGAKWHLELLIKEIQYRFENKISITDGQDNYL